MLLKVASLGSAHKVQAQLKADDSVDVLVLEPRSDDFAVVSECTSLVVNAVKCHQTTFYSSL